LGDTLSALRDGLPVQVGYNTTFLILWPEHLGGGQVSLEMEGTMLLTPLMASD
jgi:hypothetical protein